MKLVFSISNQLVKLTKLDIPRLTDEQGENPGVQSIVTHSTQISWQFQIFNVDHQWVVMVIEAYSRYTLILPYVFKPDWPQIEADFNAQWLEEMLKLMDTGGFVRTDPQIEHVIAWLEQSSSTPVYYRNLDRSIGGHLADNQQWLWSYLDEVKPKYFSPRHASELCEHLNQLPRRVNKQRGQKHTFIPVDRFLDDSLYRFAQGLCDQPIPGNKIGDFPNPHRKNVALSIVQPNTLEE